MNRILHIPGAAYRMVGRFYTGRRPDRVEAASRLLSALLLVGAALGAAELFLRVAPAHAERQMAQAPVEPEAKGSKLVKANSVAASPSSPRRVWVDPPPLPSAEQVQGAAVSGKPAPPPAEPAPKAASVVQAASYGAPSMPMDCLPADLRGVLKDVEARFGPVAMVSTTELHTDNHSRGSVRHKLHAGCKAADFKVKADVRAVTAYLRSRPEVAGINAFRNNGVIHIDYNERRRLGQRKIVAAR